MPDLQSMTLAERMNTINSESDIHAYTFEEACNKYVKTNISGYSAISLNKYTAREAFNIIRGAIFDGTGSELINATNDRTFAGSNNWATYDASGSDVALSTTGGRLQVTTTTDADGEAGAEKEGAQLATNKIKGSTGTATDLVVDATYTVSMDLDLTTPGSGIFEMTMELGGDSATFNISTTETTYTKEFTITDTSSSLKIYNNSATATVFTIDNVSVKRKSLHELDELINEMGPYEAHEYTATEALNKKNAVVVP